MKGEHVMRKLNLDRCEISEEMFTPNMVMDKNLYDDICVETGLFTCSVYCDNDDDKIQKAIRKVIMMLEAYNNGYIKAINGKEYGLKSVFGVIGEPKYKYKGGRNLEIYINIASLSYNPYMHMVCISDCLSAGNSSTMVPDFRKYFNLDMDDELNKEFENDEIVEQLKTQIEPFRQSIVNQMRPLV